MTIRFAIIFLILAVASAAGATSLQSNGSGFPGERNPLSIKANYQVFQSAPFQKMTGVVETRDGTFCFSSLTDGLWTYNGVEYSCLGLTDVPLQDLIQTSDGRILVGSDLGIYQVEKDGRITPLLPDTGNFLWMVSSFIQHSSSRLFAAGLWGLFEFPETGRIRLFCAPHLVPMIQNRFPEIEPIAVPETACIRKGFSKHTQLNLITSLSVDFISAVYASGPQLNETLPPGTLITGDSKNTPVFRRMLSEPSSFPLTIRIKKSLKQQETSSLTLDSANLQTPGFFLRFSPTKCFEDNRGRLWLQFTGKGIVQWTPEKGSASPQAWKQFPGGSSYLGTGWTTQRVGQRRDGTILAIGGGLHRLDNGHWKHLQQNKKRREKLKLMNSSCGLLAFNLETIYDMEADLEPLISFEGEELKQIHETKSSTLWIDGQDLRRFSMNSSPYRRFDNLRYIGENTRGNWFMTAGGRILRASSDLKVQEQYPPPEKNMKLITMTLGADQQVTAVYVKNGTCILVHNPGPNASITDTGLKFYEQKDNTLLATRDSNGDVWLTYQYSFSIREEPDVWRIAKCRTDPIKGLEIETRTVNDFNSLIPRATTFWSDRDGTIWLGGSRLLAFTDGDLMNPKLYPLSGVTVTAISANEEREIVLAADSGIRYIRDLQLSRSNSRQLPPRILSLTQIKNKCTAALTRNGIYFFDHRGIVRSTASDILPELDNPAEIIGDSSAALWINDTTGCIRVELDTVAPQVHFSDSPKEVDASGHILLRWQGSDYFNTRLHQLQYATRLNHGPLSSFSEDTSRQLLDLPPGDYTLTLIARDQAFNQSTTPAEFSFTVIPPIYQRLWFQFMSVAFLLSLLTVAWMWKQKVRREARFAVEIERLGVEQQQQINSIRINFFTNISHEFRTPLTLIQGPAEQLLEKNPEDEEAKLILRNTRRLLRLVNQLLDFRKIEAGKMILDPCRVDLMELTKDISSGFARESEQKQITFSSTLNPEHLITDIDIDKYEKILYNLLGNALNYTPAGGNIELNMNTRDSQLQLSVFNSGKGIAEEELPCLFDPFQRASSSAGKRGTGLGLALVHELLEILGGELTVNSTLGKGCTFTITLPLQTPPHAADPNLPESNPENKPILLIVDDTEDIRHYIRSNFKDEFHIIEAADGKTALELAEQHQPALTICDVMMPVMDGIEFCQLLRSSSETSHLPIILLTAKTSNQAQLDGLHAGADDYITKPFNIKILKQRAQTVLDACERFRDNFSRNVIIQPNEVTVSSIDAKFAEDMLAAMEKIIDDPDFNAGQLADVLNVSRRTLYRKVKSLTGESVNIFMRNFRMKRAAQLLRDNVGTISEIALSVGYIDSSFFSASFRELYDMSPTQYRTQNASRKEET